MMNHPSPDVIYFHTFPRSGSHWFRYCFEFITKRKSERLQDENIIWTKETGASYPRALYHSHDPSSFHLCTHVAFGEKVGENTGDPGWRFAKNVMIMRNYKEALLSELINRLFIIRTNLADPHSATRTPPQPNPQWVEYCRKHLRIPIANLDLISMPSVMTLDDASTDLASMEKLIKTHAEVHRIFLGLFGQYCGLLQFHHLLREKKPENALEMYYEDFMQDPERQLKRLVGFLAHHKLPLLRNNMVYHNNLKELIANLDYHRDTCMRTYQKKGHLAKTYTKSSEDINFNYYSSFFSDEFLDKMDKSMEILARDLYPNYLRRYAGLRGSTVKEKI